MGRLKPTEIRVIERHLDESGLSHHSLKSEFLDHLICDVEMRMSEQLSFSQAWYQVKNEISQRHLKKIEKETMELLSRKPLYEKIFIGLSVTLLAYATYAHLFVPLGTGGGFITFLAISIAALLIFIGSVRNVYVQKGEGRGPILFTAILISIFVVYVGILLVRLEALYFLGLISIPALAITFPLWSIYFLNSGTSVKDHRLIRWVNENQKTMELVVFVALGFGMIRNYHTILTGAHAYYGVVYAVMAAVLAGLSAYSLTWVRYSKSDSNNANSTLLIVSSFSLFMLLVPMLGTDYINATTGNFMIALGYIMFAMISIRYYTSESLSDNRSILASISWLLALYPLFKIATFIGWLGLSPDMLGSNMILNLGIMTVLITLLILFNKEQVFKWLLIMIIILHMIPPFASLVHEDGHYYDQFQSGHTNKHQSLSQ